MEMELYKIVNIAAGGERTAGRDIQLNRVPVIDDLAAPVSQESFNSGIFGLGGSDNIERRLLRPGRAGCIFLGQAAPVIRPRFALVAPMRSLGGKGQPRT